MMQVHKTQARSRALVFITGIDFEKIRNTRCNDYGYDTFDTLEEAKNECKTSKQCKGVLDKDCRGQQQYYLCTEHHELITAIESCVYRKFLFGKNISEWLEKNTYEY